jgi:hypothetical protein
MTRDRFRASVQYNDFTGSSAADRADKGGPEDWLRSKNLMKPAEFVLGVDIWAGENPGVHYDPITVHFLLTTGSFDSVKQSIASDSGVVAVRRVTTEMGVADFMGLFKRFSVYLSPGGMLNDRNYSYTED